MRYKGCFISICIAVSMCFSSVSSVFAEIPHKYWQFQDPFAQSVESGNYQEAIRIGNEIIQVFETQQIDKDKAGILNGVYSKLAVIYEGKGDYDNAINSLQKHAEYSQYLGFDDSVKLAQARIRKINPMTAVYTLCEDETSNPYYGAINEPKIGAYYGRTYTEQGKDLVQGESAVSFYVECLDENVWDFDYMIRPYADGKRMIHIALNMPQENDTLTKILNLNDDSYFVRTMEYLKSLNTPVLLRIGGEMNVWTKLAQPESFKQVFIKIANKAHTIAPNVAVVFSPNDISTWDSDITRYYPGDEYVDWVGVSLYTNQFMNANNPVVGEDHEEMFYGNGLYANPIAKLKEIVELYGDKKPIIITEGATGYNIKGKMDLTQFAKNRMDTLYTYVTMVYPQVKGIIYFDTNIDKSQYSYHLLGNQTILNEYKLVTENNPTLIKEMKSPKSYVLANQYKNTQDMQYFYTYCGLRNDIPVTVTYNLDGVQMLSSTQAPYEFQLNYAGLLAGTHTLEVHIVGGNGYDKKETIEIIK